MPYYRRVGEVPPKRHTQFRAPDGHLYAEELMGTEGFSASSALLYHRRPPTALLGADRIAANGDVANKIGTYAVALAAARHGVPFYVAAPLSTIDLDTADGAAIPIEQRSAREMTHFGPTRIAPDGAGIWNPCFDVTPARLISGIITEKGIIRPPYPETLRAVFAMG